jgi:general secretion pathway protein C
MKRWPLITSFILFITLCVSAAYWAMQLFKPPVRAIAAPPKVERPAPSLDAATGMLGGRAPLAVASNYQLKGVVVAAKPAESVAILAVNGKPAKAVRTSREVMPGVTVSEVHRDHVLLEGGAVKRVELSTETRKQVKVGTYTSAPIVQSPREKRQKQLAAPTQPDPAKIYNNTPRHPRAKPGNMNPP